jgi:hypothetical protein
MEEGKVLSPIYFVRLRLPWIQARRESFSFKKYFCCVEKVFISCLRLFLLSLRSLCRQPSLTPSASTAAFVDWGFFLPSKAWAEEE